MRPLPLPLEPILNSPTLAVAGAAVHGAVLSIVLAYWRSGCHALPADEAGLAALSRCYGAQWHRVRQPVMRALAEITPQLENAHARMLRAREARQAIARIAGVASAQRRREAKQPVGSKSMLAQPPPAMTPIARHQAPYRNPMADLRQLAEVSKRNEQLGQARTDGLLTTPTLRDRRQ
jgi:hypothetical protein